MIGPSVIRQKGAELLDRSRALRMAQFSDPIDRTYAVEAIRTGEARADLTAWLRGGSQTFARLGVFTP